MTTNSHASRAPRSLRSVVRLSALSAALMAAGFVHASPVPANLGNGLSEIAAANYAARNPASPLARQRQLARAVSPDMAVATTSDMMMRDALGRLLVNLVVDGRAAYDQVRASLAAIRSVRIAAEDRRYRAGIIEAYVSEDLLITVAKLPGVSAVHAVIRPTTNVGAVTQQGVVQHRVDQLPASLNGTGITIGVLSDSYNTGGSTLSIREADDIASCDLPGAGNPCGNTTPVVVLEDYMTYPSSGGDEGRAMAQLIHDIAPKARIGFASAFNGNVSFANNIRALAGVSSAPKYLPGFAAQVIVDDVQYYDEGMFADTLIAQAVDDVTALGVSYFSSAGNTPPTQGYASDLRIVPNDANAVAGTNIVLSGAPAALYAGGFHNFRSDGGQDIAQTITLPSNRVLQMVAQWDDPYDVTPTSVGALVVQQTGTLSAASPVFDLPLNNAVAGKQYQIDVRGDSNTTGAGNLDVIVSVIAPDGTTLRTVDTGTSETFTIYLPQTGTYTIRVTGYSLGGFTDTGNLVATVNEVGSALSVTSDYNLLFFRSSTGAYLGCICENNITTNRPVELGSITFPSTLATVQMVIARSNTPTAPNPASRIRYKTITAAYPSEYFSYTSPVTYGHNSAAGANNVAAYSPFAPNIPEDFTSSGPVRVVWDRFNKRIPDDQQVRLKPNLAAMDGGNTTFFVSDSNRDLDAFPNFFGTSAAAPTAAAIAALVLQNKGGPGAVTPAQMRTMLERSTFAHDLDPYSATGQATASNRGKVTVTLQGDNSALANTDPNAFSISYTGTSSITSITFDASNANPGGGNVSVPSTPGLVFDTRFVLGQPFVFGTGSVGLTSANVAATPLNQAPSPAVMYQYFGLRLDFMPGVFTGGKALKFGVGRDTFRSSYAPPTGDVRPANSGDLAGSVVRQPAGTTATGGITFTGTLADGSTFSGIMANRIGSGYSALDGFGFINAQSAVNQPIP